MPLAFAAGFPVLIFGCVMLVFFMRSGIGDSGQGVDFGVQRIVDQSSSSESLGKFIAVLPLENMSPYPKHAYFADGVHENILTNLALDENVEVISRSTMMPYRNTKERFSTIAEKLGARYLVEGSVRRSGDQVRITLQLLDAENGHHIWAENYSRSLDWLAETEAEVAREIARQIANRI